MPIKSSDLDCLYEHALGRTFIIETGGGGKSTIYLARSAEKSDAIMVSIEEKKSRVRSRMKNVDYQVGWSIKYNDFIKKSDKEFKDLPTAKRRSKYKWADRKVACKGKKFMKGRTNLIRKMVQKYQKPMDFFFCDTGEFCGLAEWNVVKEIMRPGCIFACHDIYYPKSIKCYQVAKQIERSDAWEVLEKTKTRQGLMIAKKIDNA